MFLAFGQTMVDSLGNKGYCTTKSVFRVLGVIGHFYNDVKFSEVFFCVTKIFPAYFLILNFQAEKLLFTADGNHDNQWTDVEIGFLQQSFYNEFVKNKFSL